MSVNIQTKTGLLKIAETCHCENSGETPTEAMYSAQPVEMIADEAGLGDYLQLSGCLAFSPDDVTAQPVEDVNDQFIKEV